jgi:hypothetical protein
MTIDWSERRREPRYEVRLDAVVAADREMLFPCLIVDINRYGARIDAGAHEPPEEFFLIDVMGATAYRARRVWTQSPLAGTRFLETLALPSYGAPGWLTDLRQERLKVRAQAVGLRLVGQ